MFVRSGINQRLILQQLEISRFVRLIPKIAFLHHEAFLNDPVIGTIHIHQTAITSPSMMQRGGATASAQMRFHSVFGCFDPPRGHRLYRLHRVCNRRSARGPMHQCRFCVDIHFLEQFDGFIP